MLNVKALFVIACVAMSGVARAAESDPASVVAAFYRADLTHGDTHAYLAADTVKLLDEADKANKSGKLVLDYDPFCGCQVAMFGATPSKAIIEGNV
ncbi:MAG TPA: hypothetical protein VFN49_05670, partial [Candidatus Aquilonibacter sp.]|nr:hypothetical protein [Candidatus Aquilonibacter sp.]